MTDLHCHILPGMDDGAKDTAVSLELLHREYEDGVLQIEFYEEDALEKAVKLMEDNHYVVHRR